MNKLNFRNAKTRAVTLLGMSGAGKTTLLQILYDVLKEGSI